MLSKWPIRNKLLIGIGLLLVIVATLSWSGFHGVYAYRSPCAVCAAGPTSCRWPRRLSGKVSDLRVIVGEVRSAPRRLGNGPGGRANVDQGIDPPAVAQRGIGQSF